jgi:hypothetical protein
MNSDADLNSFEVAVPRAHRRRLNEDVDDDTTNAHSKNGGANARPARPLASAALPPELDFVEDDGKPLLLDADLAPETTVLEPAF